MPDTEERKRTAKDALLAVFACFAIAGCVYIVNKQPPPPSRFYRTKK